MTPQLLILLTVSAAASAFPSYIYDFKTDYMDIEQKGTPGKSVEGEYSWVAPNGREIFVKYIADKRGFRVIDSKNNFNDFDFDRSSSSSAGEEDNYSVQEISPVKATHRKSADAQRSEHFRSFSPAAAPVSAPKRAPIATPKITSLTAPKTSPVTAPKTSPFTAPKAAPLTAPKSTPIAAPAATRAGKTVSKIEPKAEEKKESAPAPAAGTVKKSDDLTAAALAKGSVEVEATTSVAAKETAPAEGEEGAEGGAEEGGEEGAEAEEGAEVEEAEMEEEAEAEEMEEV